jgi:hypothetical protein
MPKKEGELEALRWRTTSRVVGVPHPERHMTIQIVHKVEYVEFTLLYSFVRSENINAS